MTTIKTGTSWFKCIYPGCDARWVADLGTVNLCKMHRDERPQKKCTGCGADLRADVAMLWSVCNECLQARKGVVMGDGRCHCSAKERKPRSLRRGDEGWVACDRCLGIIA